MKIILFLIFFSFQLYSQNQGGKLWGYVFGDYFYKVSGDSADGSVQYSAYSNSYQAFELRRIYLGYDYIFSDRFSSSFLLEGNDKVLTSSRHGIFIKSAFVEWKAFERVSFAIGLVPTPTWSWALNEKFWAYRSVEKTITDMRGLGIASDIGISSRGTFDKTGNYGFALMIGNGSGQRPEINKYKKYYATLYARPFKNFQSEVYADYEPRGSDHYSTTLRFFAGYSYSKFNLGFEAVNNQISKKGVKVSALGISGFVHTTLVSKSEKPVLNVFARFDLFNRDLNNDSTGYRENFIVAGLDYMPIENIHFMPNLWMNLYHGKSGNSPRRESDIVARFTFFYKYK